MEQQRNLSLTKPSGLTGDTKPYPVCLHHWTVAEFEQFLSEHKFPRCTCRDRLRHHRRAVEEALYADQWVPAAVLQDYPDAGEYAHMRREAAEERKQMRTRSLDQILLFQTGVAADEVLSAIKASIQVGMNLTRPWRVTLPAINPLGGNDWSVRFLERDKVIGIFRNHAQAECWIDCFWAVPIAELHGLRGIKPYYFKRHVDVHFAGDVVRKDGTAFGSAGAAQTAAAGLNRPWEYTIAECEGGFMLTRIVMVPDHQLYHCEPVRRNNATVEHIDSHGSCNVDA